MSSEQETQKNEVEQVRDKRVWLDSDVWFVATNELA